MSDDVYGEWVADVDDDAFVANVSCRNGSLVAFGGGLVVAPGGAWVRNGSDWTWNGTDCLERGVAATLGFALPLGILVPAAAAVAAAAVLSATVCLLERRRKRLLRVHADAPVSLTEDNQNILWRLLVTLFDLVQTVVWGASRRPFFARARRPSRARAR